MTRDGGSRGAGRTAKDVMQETCAGCGSRFLEALRTRAGSRGRICEDCLDRDMCEA